MSQVAETQPIAEVKEAPKAVGAVQPTTITNEQKTTAETSASVQETGTPTQKLPETTQGASKDDEAFRQKFSIITKRERALREKIKELEAKEAAIKEKETKFVDFEKDPYAWAQKNGISYEEWTKRLLNGDKPTAETHIKRLEDEIRSLRTEREEEKKRALQENTQKEINQFVNSLANHVKTNSDKYEMISHEGQEGLETVYNYILEYHREHDELLSFDRACEDVEKHLTDRALKLKELKKFKELFKEPVPPETEGAPKESDKAAEPKGETASTPKITLTNQMASQSGTPVAPKKLSREESIARAAALLKFT